MSSNEVSEAFGHKSVGTIWDENKTVYEGALETVEMSQNMAVDIAHSSSIVYPGVSSSSTVQQGETSITPSAEDIAV